MVDLRNDGAGLAADGRGPDAEELRAEIRKDLSAYAAYVTEHGSPTEMLRRHLAKSGDAV